MRQIVRELPFLFLFFVAFPSSELSRALKGSNDNENQFLLFTSPRDVITLLFVESTECHGELNNFSQLKRALSMEQGFRNIRHWDFAMSKSRGASHAFGADRLVMD